MADLELNEVIHQPVRLQIMAALTSMEPENEVNFTYLQDMLKLTSGNLGAHLRKLEESGYVIVNKAFIDRKPCTFISASKAGRQAFREHVAVLESIINSKEN
jgi:DNA-binding MarR family transcriptional regulator